MRRNSEQIMVVMVVCKYAGSRFELVFNIKPAMAPAMINILVMSK